MNRRQLLVGLAAAGAIPKALAESPAIPASELETVYSQAFADSFKFDGSEFYIDAWVKIGGGGDARWCHLAWCNGQQYVNGTRNDDPKIIEELTHVDELRVTHRPADEGSKEEVLRSLMRWSDEARRQGS